MTSPFDNLKDMFSSLGGNNKKDKDEARGFKTGNVEVFSSDDDVDNEDGDDMWSPRSRQQAMEAEVIDAELMESWGDELGSSAEQFSTAWRGGPDSHTTASSFASTINGGDGAAAATTYDIGIAGDSDAMTNDAIILKAQQLLTNNPGVREIVSRAQSNPSIRDAVLECAGNPAAFGGYLEDPEAGPILNELKEFILS